jgi:O-antigen/teichoic acid export membrane protein
MVVMNVTANLIYIPLYGYIGASLTTVATEWIAMMCFMGMTWTIWKSTAKLRFTYIGAANIIFFVVYFFLFKIWVPAAVLFGLSGLVGIAFLLLFKVKNDRQYLWNLLRSSFNAKILA